MHICQIPVVAPSNTSLWSTTPYSMFTILLTAGITSCICARQVCEHSDGSAGRVFDRTNIDRQRCLAGGPFKAAMPERQRCSAVLFRTWRERPGHSSHSAGKRQICYRKAVEQSRLNPGAAQWRIDQPCRGRQRLQQHWPQKPIEHL